MANSIATSLIEKATTKFYDENTSTGPVSDPSGLTTSLGTESGESSPDNFNDFDDFNNYADRDTFFSNLFFDYRCEVCYVSPSSLDIPSAKNTWHKKLTVYVTWNQSGKQTSTASDTIKQSVVYSYWSF